MTGTPHVEERTEKWCVYIPVSASLNEWGRVVSLMPEVKGWVRDRGLAATSGPFFRILGVGGHDEPFDIQVGVAVGQPAEGDGRVLAGSMPEGRYAVLMHVGHPHEIGRSHAAMAEWASNAGAVWDETARFETYVTDPEKEPDSSKWETELAYRLKA